MGPDTTLNNIKSHFRKGYQMQIANSALKIDEKRAVEGIEKYIQKLVAERSAKGVLIGLSGGVDSALLATLAVRALGKERVHVSYLYDRDSEKDSERKARLMADWLGLELEIQDIEPTMKEKRIYAPLIMQLSAISGFTSRHFINNSYRLLFAETPFMSSLRQGKFEGHWFKKLVYNFTVRHIAAGFNARHICRREFLEKRAKDQNLILLGAANRSECLVGWFVKDGIDDLPLSPLMGLYKTQIRQIAIYLGLPSEIQNQVPSPDMMKGITDEFAMGISYNRIDIIMDGMDRGLIDEEMISAGVTMKEISRVREMNHLSDWKRKSKHTEPPVDGGVRGGLRVALGR